jgi:hypothetical protein
MLSFLSTFQTYFLWSVEFLVVPPYRYITLFVAINLAASIIKQRPFKRSNWVRTVRFPAIVFLCFIATIAVAAGGYVSVNHISIAEPNHWGLRACHLLAFMSFGAGTYWIYRLKGLRWFAVSVTFLQLWLLAGANFIAVMALTGDWI